MRIEALGVSAGYGDADVLREIGLSLRAGEFVGLIGPNGSGKSTLLRALSGTLPLSRGEVRLDGRDVRLLTRREVARKIAFVPQTESPAFDFTVRDIALMGRNPHVHGRSGETPEDYAQATRAMAATDILHLADRPVTGLSGGEFRRAVIARALAQSTPTILLDEPTAHLDLPHQRDILMLLRSQVDRDESACLAALHDLNLAAAFCDQLILLAGGRVEMHGPVSEVLRPDVLVKSFGPGIRVSRRPGEDLPIVLPDPMDSRAVNHRSLRIHVICGGGSGAEALALLQRLGHRVSAGVLNRTDSDQSVCESLGIPHVVEAPFSPIGAPAREECEAMTAEADALVIAPVPFGAGNLANLELASRAQEQRAVVYLLGPISLAGRDFTDGRASRLWDRLIAGGACSVPDVLALDTMLSARNAVKHLSESRL